MDQKEDNVTNEPYTSNLVLSSELCNFTVNKIKIKIEKQILTSYSTFFKETMTEKNFNNMEFTIDYNNKYIVLFFSMLKLKNNGVDKIDIINCESLYKLSIFFGIDAITHNIINFVINNSDNKQLNKFMINNKPTLLYNYKNPKLLNVYIVDVHWGLKASDS